MVNPEHSTDFETTERQGVSSTSVPVIDSFQDSLERLARAEFSNPGTILGPHPIERGDRKLLAIRTLQPTAASVSVRLTQGGEEFATERIHPAGIFEARLPASAAIRAIPGGYYFRVRYEDGSTADLQDPYNFPPLLTDFDLYLIGEGTHHGEYEKLGAHVREIARIRGVHFAVWAPNALRVSVVGDFNQWDGRRHRCSRAESPDFGNFSFPKRQRERSTSTKSGRKTRRCRC